MHTITKLFEAHGKSRVAVISATILETDGDRNDVLGSKLSNVVAIRSQGPDCSSGVVIGNIPEARHMFHNGSRPFTFVQSRSLIKLPKQEQESESTQRFIVTKYTKNLNDQPCSMQTHGHNHLDNTGTIESND